MSGAGIECSFNLTMQCPEVMEAQTHGEILMPCVLELTGATR